MNNVAVFEDGIQAEETARVLREQGYDASVAMEGDAYGAVARRFVEGDMSFKPVAVVTSNADGTSFDHAVQIHHGRVITGTI